MTIADEYAQIAPGVFYWSAYAKDLKADLTSSALIHDDQLYFFDPIKLKKEALDKLGNMARPKAVILTSETHGRDAAFYHDKYSIPIYAHTKSIKKLSPDVLVDYPVEKGDTLFGFLEVIHLPGTKEGECAYFVQGGSGVCIIGDALINLQGYGFSLLPEKYSDDPLLSRRSLLRLSGLEIKLMLFAHGEPIIHDVNKKLSSLLGIG